MSKYTFRLANSNDGKSIKPVLEAVMMEGKIAITTLLVEDFWEDINWASDDALVMVCETDSKIVAVASIVVYSMWLAGRPEKIGYLTQLRINPEYRKGTVLARGFKFLSEARKQLGIKYFFTSILENNLSAKQVLLGQRAGLPGYKPLFPYCTYLIRAKKNNIRVEKSLTGNQSHKDFDLVNWSKLSGIASYTTTNNIATISLTTDPTKKTTLIKSYSKLVKHFRPFYNMSRWLHGGIYLPPIGKTIPVHYVTGLSYSSDVALNKLLNGLGHVLESKYFAIGLIASHPLNTFFKKRACLTINSTIYQVMWPDSPSWNVGQDPLLSVALL